MMILCGALVLALAGGAWRFRVVRRENAVLGEKIGILDGMILEQKRLLSDAEPIFRATIQARQEMMAKEQELALDREATRATIVRLRRFLFHLIDTQLPNQVAAIARRNVKMMLDELPQVPPPLVMPADTTAPVEPDAPLKN